MEAQSKILIVDDMPGHIKTLAKLLRPDYRIFTATRGSEALALARHEPDLALVLLDVIMPDMDGYQVCQQLQNHPQTRQIPVIFITSKGAGWDEQRGLQLGAVDFITRPVRPPIVLARVKTHIELKKQRDFLNACAHQLEVRVEERTNELQATIDQLSREIAHRYQTEQALIASRLQLQAIVDTAIDGIITIDERGMIEFVNSAGEKMFGYDSGTLLGQNVKILMSAADAEHHDTYLQRFLATPKPVFGGVSREVVGKKRDGTLFPLELSIAQLKPGDRLLFTGMLRDISQRKKAAEFAIRSARLASLGSLAAGVAHEINNPNNAIGFAASTIMRLWQDLLPVIDDYRQHHGEFEICGLPVDEGLQTMAEMIDAVEENTRRIAAIIANLKHMAKGDVANLNQQVEVHKVLRSAVTILQNVIRKQTNRFAMTLAATSFRVTGNSQQLEQVFINLLQNALQSLPARERGVTVTTRLATLENHPAVAVEIRDEGTGIDRERMELITRPFYTTKGDEGGIGLGLSITKTILDNHHGALLFESEPGQGTQATVYLPLAPDTGREAP